MNKIKHIVFDIDGTISELGKKVDQTLCDFIYALSKQYGIIFASARPVRDMLPMLDQKLHKIAVWIGCNGAMAYHNEQFIFSNVIANEKVIEIVSFLKEKKQPYVLDGKWGFSLSQQEHDFHHYILSLSEGEVEEDKIVLDGVTKILILSNQYKQEIIEMVGDELAINTHRQEDFFDLTAKGNNKYMAINHFVKGDNYIAFGNDQNDFLMLDNAELSIFIGNESIYSKADYYCCSPKEVLSFLKEKFNVS